MSEKINKKETGKNIAKEMIKKRVDMLDVASHLDIDSSTIKKWKDGKVFSNLVNMIQLSHFLGVPVEDLISEEKEAHQQKDIKGQMSLADAYPDAMNN